MAALADLEFHRSAEPSRPKWSKTKGTAADAWRAYQDRDYETALDGYVSLLPAFPGDADLLGLIGATLRQLGRHDEALAYFARASADNSVVAGMYGIALAEIGRYEDALPHLEKTAAALPTDPDAIFNLALALAKLGELNRAARAIDESLVQLRSQDVGDLLDLRRIIVESKLWGLVRRGLASWDGGKPRGSRPPVPITPGPPISDLLLEDRI